MSLMVLEGKEMKGTKGREVKGGGGGRRKGREGQGREGTAVVALVQAGRQVGRGQGELEAPVEAAAWIGQLRYPYLCSLSRAGSPG